MTTRARPAPERVRWWKTLRIAALLLILALVALTTWQDRYRSTRWREPLFVAIYPMAADESPVTRRYVESLVGGEFKAIDRFFTREAARYHLGTDEPFRSRLRPAFEDRPPERSAPAGPVATGFWSLKLCDLGFIAVPGTVIVTSWQRIRCKQVKFRREAHRPLDLGKPPSRNWICIYAI